MTTPSGLTHVRWTDVAKESLTDAIQRRYINTGTMTIARFELSRGGVVPRHSHEHEQVTNVLSGALKFVTPDAEVIVRQGESITIAPWLEHRVDVLEDAVVIDVFCPVRQDWVTKTDHYFKNA
jgi:quercetin dioxygenase-like cupin family protein